MSRIQIPQTPTPEQWAEAQTLMGNIDKAIGALLRYAAPQMGTRYALADGETTADYGGEDETPLTLVCPWCGQDVTDDSLYDREIAERWTYADIDGGDAALSFWYDGYGDYESITLVHEPCGLPVSAPEGW